MPRPHADGSGDQAPSFAAQLQRVIDVMRFDGARATDEMIAAEVGVSARYVGQLRKGERTNPSPALVDRIAEYFGVDPAFFTDAARAVEIGAQLDLLDALTSNDLRRLAFRGDGLSPQDLAAAVRLIERLQDQS